MKTSLHEKPNSPGITLLKVLCATLLAAVTLVSLSFPAFDWIDEWADKLDNQLRIFAFFVGIIIIFTIRWFVRFIKRQ